MDCLIIDDEVDLTNSVIEYFEYNTITAKGVNNLAAALEVLQNEDIGCVLLDINFPNASGYDIARKIRTISNLPIIFISGRRDDEDIIAALVSGGDDYIKKPFSLSVLTAKIKVVLKRFRPTNIDTVLYKDLKINCGARTVSRGGNDLQLNNTEFRLFQRLLQNKGSVVNKYEIIKSVWGDGYYTDSTLNVYIRRLREKVEIDGNNPEYIKTIWGEGYMLND